MDDDTKLIKRREALRTGLRLGGLGGLVALAAGLSLRNGGCAKASPCEGCPAFVDCGLPKAKQMRKAAGAEVSGTSMSALVVAEGLRPSGGSAGVKGGTDRVGLDGVKTAGTTQSSRYVQGARIRTEVNHG